MSKPSKEDPLIGEIGRELMPGHFFRRDEVSDLVTNLGGMHRKLEVLVEAGGAARAVRLYEVLLTGVYAKIEEADDECDLSMLFHRLACGWIRARQAAGLPGEETLRQLLNWMKNDNYGFCCEIEKEVTKALANKDPLAAAKLYRAVGLRILGAGKSKYYDAALDHFKKARNLYCGAGQTPDWEELAATVRHSHSRKRGFLAAFEGIASGKSKCPPSFAEQAQEQWKRRTS